MNTTGHDDASHGPTHEDPRTFVTRATQHQDQASEDDPRLAAAHVMTGQLLEPFAESVVGKRPQPTCRDCLDSPSKVCSKHNKAKCETCGQYMTTAHMHLDYIGHAEVTQRLLRVDPYWNWEPLAVDERGLPVFDQFGGMWIKLTVGGITRIGYGDSVGKRPGPHAIKEAIGDAIRNAAMRFGVALGLWGASVQAEVTPGESVPMVNQGQHKRMHGLWAKLGFGGPANRDTRLEVTGRIVGRHLETSEGLTEAEANSVIEALNTRLRVQTEQAAHAEQAVQDGPS